MKVIALIGLVLIAVAVLVLYQQNKDYIPVEENIPSTDILQDLIDKSPQSVEGEELKSSFTIETELEADIERQIAEAKTELEELMLEYNDNLKNLDKRKLLETKITLLLSQYNQLVLPDALEKVKEHDNPSS